MTAIASLDPSILDISEKKTLKTNHVLPLREGKYRMFAEGLVIREFPKIIIIK